MATAATNAGHVGANATATHPAATNAVAIIKVWRAGQTWMVRIAMSTPNSEAAKWTLIVEPATGRLTPKRCVMCSRSGPYADTTRPMNRKVAPTAAVAVRVSTTRSARILFWIKDQDREKDIGRYAGWGAGEDLTAAPGEGERHGPALAPFLRYRATDRAWRLAFGCMWLPAIIVVLAVEEWMGVSPGIQWISLGVVFVVFMAIAFLPVQLRR
jgi:hypothetical protein